jgi:thioredoxin 1
MAPLDAVSDATFGGEVLRAAQPVLVDFWAEWCGPCKRMHVVLEELAGELAGRVRIVRLDVATNPQTPAEEGVLNLPTMILYRDGRPVERWGSMSKEQLRKRLAKALSDRFPAGGD